MARLTVEPMGVEGTRTHHLGRFPFVAEILQRVIAGRAEEGDRPRVVVPEQRQDRDRSQEASSSNPFVKAGVPPGTVCNRRSHSQHPLFGRGAHQTRRASRGARDCWPVASTTRSARSTSRLPSARLRRACGAPGTADGPVTSSVTWTPRADGLGTWLPLRAAGQTPTRRRGRRAV